MYKIKLTAINNLINGELIYKYAKDRNTVEVSAKDVDEEINNIKKMLPPKQTLDQVLKRSKMSMSELREHFKQKIAVRRMTQTRIQDIKKNAEALVNEAYLKNYYDNNLHKFKEPEQVHISSILIKADPSGGQKVWNESFKKAQEIIKKARDGQDFAELAKKYSEDPNAQKGGDMGWSHLGSLFEEIDASVVKMKTGEISEPVMTIYGYHILKLEGKKPSVQKKFEAINKDQLKADLVSKERAMQWGKWIRELRSASKIEYLAEDIKPKAGEAIE
jgi:parvulin-like peptidyl-prolyl isomerase